MKVISDENCGMKLIMISLDNTNSISNMLNWFKNKTSDSFRLQPSPEAT